MLVCYCGFFGENCVDECFDICNDCNGVIGLCEYGCFFGWIGYFCKKGYFNFNYDYIGIFISDWLFVIIKYYWVFLYVKLLFLIKG